MAVQSSSRGTAGLALFATLVAGLGTYAFLAIGSRSLADEASDLFAVFWSLSLILGFGFFLPIEQMLASGQGLAPRWSSRLMLTAGTLMAVAVVFAAAATGIATGGWTRPGSLALSVAVGAMLVTAPLQFSVRGAALRLGRNRLYSIMLIVDASGRVIVALLAALVATDDAPPIHARGTPVGPRRARRRHLGAPGR
ncbi:hypothetical protein [Arenivirga flava]|uniref:Uncharacterized protein n=1 Tax=Arenivirga flava TaxID=1930060 RepID=A0AA37UTG3_9MICO|nr:hypothetical protein [Arenivirga flava]GMA28012.1 hypothetical protein GCM10025874_12650 [Arenivirga flava]